MNESTASNPKSNPDPAVTAADQAQPLVPPRASGSALQDAEAAAQENQPEGAPVEYPAATNYADTSRSGVAKTAGASSMDGPYETDRGMQDQDRVSLHNNPNPPKDEDVQDNLPDTNPMSRPLDKDVNLPD